MAQQGYSKLNNGYGEEPGVNWGKMAAIGVGGAAAYGVIRAGAMKGKKMAGPAFRSGKAIGGGIMGMNMRGGWKGYQQLGNAVPKGIKKADAVRRIGAAEGAARTMKAAKRARAGTVDNLRSKYLSDLKTYSAAPSRLRELEQQHKGAQNAVNSFAVNRRMGIPTQGNVIQLVKEEDAARQALTNFKMPAAPSMDKVLAARKGTMANDFNRIAGLKPATRAVARPSAPALTSLENNLAGAKGFFGAMDYAKAGGLKQFGVGAARVGGAMAAVGLGMKALNALNPFSD